MKVISVNTLCIVGLAKQWPRNGGHFTCRLYHGGSISTKGWRSRQFVKRGDVQLGLESVKK